MQLSVVIGGSKEFLMSAKKKVSVNWSVILTKVLPQRNTGGIVSNTSTVVIQVSALPHESEAMKVINVDPNG